MSYNFIWPFKSPPRQSQIHALDWLLSQQSKYLILEAPTGTGKSNLGLAYSFNLAPEKGGDSFILTPQRILQQQYEDIKRTNQTDMSLYSFYGKSNYECQFKRTNCEIGGLVNPKCNPCAHLIAKQMARNANNLVMNYKLALISFDYTTTFSNLRKLLIADECHTLEQHLIDFDAVNISQGRSQKYNLPWKLNTTTTSAIEWVGNTYLPKLKSLVQDLEYEVERIKEQKGSTKLSYSDLQKIKEYDVMLSHYDQVYELNMHTFEYLNQHFVLIHDKKLMTFKRLKGDYSFNRILDPRAEKILFMSSTILDKNGFCSDLGIDPNQAAFLSLDSEFPIDNRPVVYMPQMKMNYKWNDSDNARNRQTMLNTITKLLEIHKDESGVIHTGNFAIASWLVENLTNINHHIYHHNPESNDDRNLAINGFIKDNKPSILISPSSTEGLDLKDDLARFAIFVKVPFQSLADQWVKKRMEMSLQWYQRQALINIIQGGGRVVRSATDKGIVYILDQSWTHLKQQTNDIIPKWWKDGYQTI